MAQDRHGIRVFREGRILDPAERDEAVVEAAERMV
jgi:hypothetical protein